MARDIDICGEDGAREAVDTMDWGLVIDEGFQDGVTTVYCVGQGERADTARKLRAIADVMDPPVRVLGTVEQAALGDGERRDVGSGPDLVSRMIDARECLRAKAGPFDTGAVAAALRWLDAGIAEGMVQRELYAALRVLVAGEPHVCTCGDSLVDAAGVECPECGAPRHHSCTDGGRALAEAHPARARLAVADAKGCSDGFEDRCRFEAALRSLLGVEP